MKVKVKDAKCLYEQALLTMKKIEETTQKTNRDLLYYKEDCKEQIAYFNRIDPEFEIDIISKDLEMINKQKIVPNLIIIFLYK